MASEERKIRRILHFRFTMPDVSPEMLAMMKSTASYFQLFGNAKMRLLRNVDDPKRFIQEIDYEAPEAIEMNRQKIASDIDGAGLSADLACHVPGRGRNRRVRRSVIAKPDVDAYPPRHDVERSAASTLTLGSGPLARGEQSVT